MLSIAGRRGDLERVRRTFQWMQSQGPGRSAPSAYTYTAYIQAVGAQGHWKEAFDLYKDMRRSRVKPTSYTYSALIRSGARGGRVGAAAAAALVEDMRSDGIIPDVPIASALICAYGVLGQFTNCQRMLRATVSRCRFTLSKPMLKAPMGSALKVEYHKLLLNFGFSNSSCGATARKR